MLLEFLHRLAYIQSGDHQAPTIPTGLGYTNLSTNSFTLTWVASSDNVGVAGYNVYKDSVLYGTTSATSLAITGLSQNTGYSMTVEAYDAAGNISAKSSALVVTTTYTNPTVLVVGTNVTLSSASGSVAYNSTALSYQLTTSTYTGIATAYLLKNSTQIDSQPVSLVAGELFTSSFTLAVAANYGDSYEVQITH